VLDAGKLVVALENGEVRV